jgi:hypothetical protein
MIWQNPPSRGRVRELAQDDAFLGAFSPIERAQQCGFNVKIRRLSSFKRGSSIASALMTQLRI